MLVHNIVKLLLLVLISTVSFSCSESNTTDGDIDKEATEQTENEVNTCDEVDCSPGTCEISYGYAKCKCPEGYVISGYSCIEDTDGDADTDVEPDQDTDLDEDITEIEETPDGDTDDGIPQCTAANDVFPCRMTVPFEGPDANGLFYANAGFATFGLDVWENWIIFLQVIEVSETDSIGGGVLLMNYETKEVFKLAHQFNSDLYPVINDGYVAWAITDYGETDSENDDTSTIYTLNVETMEKKLITDSATYKFGLKYSYPYVYWLDGRQRIGQFGNPIYSVDDNGDEVRVDTQTTGEGASHISVSDNTVVYITGTGLIGVVDRTNNTQRLLSVPSDVYYRQNKVLKDSLYYYSDNRDEPNGNPEDTRCYQSIYKYDLEKNKETVIKQNTEGKDYLIEDVWGEWLLYSYYNEDNYGTEDTSLKYCGLNAADGDLFLKYLPTGEEWNITNHLGNQHRASMWGPLVVWHDTRENLKPTYGFGEFYGLDLCMHPELKSRFTECAERARKK